MQDNVTPMMSESPGRSLATTVGARVARDLGWSGVFQEGAGPLILTIGSQWLVLVPKDEITLADATFEMESWFARLNDKQFPGVNNLFVILCPSTSPSTDIPKIPSLKKTSFLGKSVQMGYLDPYRESKSLPKLTGGLAKSIRSGAQSFRAGEIVDEATYQVEVERTRQETSAIFGRLSEVQPWGTWTIFAVCLVMFLWASVVGSTENVATLLRFGANHPSLTLEAHQWWRLVGATFMHIGILHFAVNMYSLFVVGRLLEQVYGNSHYLALYAVGGLAGSLASATTGSVVSAGASGALFGLFGATVVVGYRHRKEWPAHFVKMLSSGMLPAIVYNLFYGFSQDGIDNAAHLGGLVGGCLFGLLVPPRLSTRTLAKPVHAALTGVAVCFFLVQGVVIYQAATVTSLMEAPRKTYQDSTGGLSVDVPGFFTRALVEGDVVFQGPGMNFAVTKLDDTKMVSVDNSVFTQSLAKADPSATSQVLESHGRTWLLRDYNSDQAAIRQAFVYVGISLVRIDAAAGADAPQSAEEMRNLMMSTLKTIGGDPRSTAKVLLSQSLYQRTLEELHNQGDDYEVKFMRVQAQTGLSQYDSALAELDRLSVEKSEDPRIPSLRFTVHERQKAYALCLEDLQAEVALLPKKQASDDQELFKARILQKMGRAAEADSLFKSILAKGDLTMKSRVFNTQAWYLVLKGQPEKALDLANRSIAIEETAANLDTRGVIYLETGNLEQAEVDFDKVLALDFNQLGTNYQVGRLGEKKGNQEIAQFFYARYLALAGPLGEHSEKARVRLNEMGVPTASTP